MVVVQGGIILGKMFRDKSLGGYRPGGLHGGKTVRVERGNCPEGNYLEVIVREAKVWGVVALGEFHRRQLSRRKFFQGNCPVDAKVQGIILLWGNFIGCNTPGDSCPGEKCPDTHIYITVQKV